MSPVEESSLKASSSNENVIKVVDVHQSERSDEMCFMNVELESVGVGSCTIRYSHVELGGTEIFEYQTDFLVLPFGVIYDLGYDTFSGMRLAQPLLLIMLVTLSVVLSLSFVEKIRNGDFSYSMVALGGVILFLTLALISMLVDPWFWSGLEMLTTAKMLLSLVLESGFRFIYISSVPIILLAIALGVSNVWLIKKEGFRLPNALGIIIGVMMLAGLLALELLNPYFSIEDPVWFYVFMISHLILTYLLSYFECMLLSTMICAIASTRYRPAHQMDYLIILGCAIRGDGTPTPLLRGRVQRAYDFACEQFADTGKSVKFVPSGGQGHDEVISEAESMKRTLMELGVPEEQIILEDKSVNTQQNMAFSQKVIERDAGQTEDVNIGFSTTNYHVFRGYTLARKIGMKVKGLSAKTKLYFFPNAFIREFVGLLWEEKLRHIVFISLLSVSITGLYLIILF